MSGFIKIRISILGADGWSECEGACPVREVLLAPNRHDALCSATIPLIESAVDGFLNSAKMAPGGGLVH